MLCIWSSLKHSPSSFLILVYFKTVFHHLAVCVCLRACARACMCVCARVRACLCVCTCVHACVVNEYVRGVCVVLRLLTSYLLSFYTKLQHKTTLCCAVPIVSSSDIVFRIRLA